MYPAEEAVNNIISEEEANRRYEKEYGEKYYNSDAFTLVTKEIDTDKVCVMDENEELERFACFVMICNRCSDDNVLQLVAELAQKKKNGTLYKGKVVTLAAYMGVSFNCKIMELSAKAVSDTQLEVAINVRNFDQEKYQQITSNPVLNYISDKLI